jgi:hypothetical protein
VPHEHAGDDNSSQLRKFTASQIREASQEITEFCANSTHESFKLSSTCAGAVASPKKKSLVVDSQPGFPQPIPYQTHKLPLNAHRILK